MKWTGKLVELGVPGNLEHISLFYIFLAMCAMENRSEDEF